MGNSATKYTEIKWSEIDHYGVELCGANHKIKKYIRQLTNMDHLNDYVLFIYQTEIKFANHDGKESVTYKIGEEEVRNLLDFLTRNRTCIEVTSSKQGT